jgi:aminobenzoyl-glutamate utilization protein B
MKAWRIALGVVLAAGAVMQAQGRGGGQAPPPPLTLPADTARVTALKQEAAAEVEKLKVFSQQMVDQLFSYGELGFQEFETSKYLIKVLKENGFQVEEGVAGIPTAFMATWGNGKPVIALGSDIDGIPQSSQKPGVAYHDPIVEGAPGHGEGHNSGQAVNITAAIVLKKIMEREKIAGTIRIWPGVAEELVGTKAYFIRAATHGMVRPGLQTDLPGRPRTSQRLESQLVGSFDRTLGGGYAGRRDRGLQRDHTDDDGNTFRTTANHRAIYSSRSR